MNVTTYIAVYGAVLSTVGIGWNFYKEWKESKRASSERRNRTKEQRRELYGLMQQIPGIETDFRIPESNDNYLSNVAYARYTGNAVMQINSYLDSLGPQLTTLFDLPEAIWLHNHRLIFVNMTHTQTGFYEAMQESYIGLKDLQGMYAKLKDSVTRRSSDE